MKFNHKKLYVGVFAVIQLGIFTSCGGAGESGSANLDAEASEVLSSLTEGYSLPQSISAIPSENTSQLSASNAKKISYLRRASNVGSATDYDAAGDLELKVSEPALDQFSIIETIMGTLKQTNYWDAKVINQGAYKTLVKWEEGDGFKYEYWTIKSKMIVVDGKDVNRVRFWIDGDEGIKGLIDVYSAPSSNNKYGEWRLDVSFAQGFGGGAATFSAASEPQADGSVKLSIASPESDGVLFLDNGSGKGIVKYMSECNDWPNCATVSAKMAYNDDHAIIQKDSNAARCKDRNSYADIYMDYGLYTNAGQNVNKIKTYSFPLKYQDQYYYYGGWNGRQQLWGEDASSLAVGTELDHGDYDSSATFTIDSRVKGILTKRSGVPVDLTSNSTIAAGVGSDTLQTNDWSASKFFMLVYSGSAWQYCDEWQFNWETKVCSNPVDLGTGTASSIANTDAIYDAHGIGNVRVQVVDFDDRMWQNIIDASGVSDAASFSSALDSSKVYRVNMEKMLYIQYDGVTDNQWKSCSANFSSDPWNPTLTSCVAFDWSTMAESWGKFSRHFWTNGGTQYLANLDDSDNCTNDDCLLSLVKQKEEVVKTAIAGGLEGRSYDGTSTGQTYTFDSGLQLKESGSVVTQWTGQIFDTDGNEYQWEYSSDGDWATMTYLAYGLNPPSGKSQGDLVVFDTPLQFDSLTAKNVDGADVTMKNLIYDGWLSGLPDVWKMLEENRQNDADSGLTPAQKAKIVNIPAGTSMVDSLGDTYKMKPRYGVRILDDIDAGSCTAAIDSSLTLEELEYREHGVGADPAIKDVTVIEGEFINE